MRDLRIGTNIYKYLDGLESKQYRQVTRRIHSLGRDPYPHDAKHVSNNPGCRRIDVGEFRVCYRVEQDVILVMAVDRRNDDAVYKKLGRIG
jgi:mRNA interferase RelE/StbE